MCSIAFAKLNAFNCSFTLNSLIHVTVCLSVISDVFFCLQQVDLRKLHFLALVGTQGRHADGHGQEFARNYRLRYSRDGVKWLTWKDRWGQEVSPDSLSPYS